MFKSIESPSNYGYKQSARERELAGSWETFENEGDDDKKSKKGGKAR